MLQSETTPGAPGIEILRIPPAVRAAIVAHARAEAPAECCGLLVGRGMAVETILELRNVADTPGTRYQIDPAAHIAAIRRLRGTGRSIVGCYHSHPASPPRPSETDLAHADYPEFVWIIVSLQRRDRPRIRAWRIVDGRARPVPVASAARAC